jgi:hypothetical protein
VKVAGITDYLDVSDTDAKALEDQSAYLEERDLLSWEQASVAWYHMVIFNRI